MRDCANGEAVRMSLSKDNKLLCKHFRSLSLLLLITCANLNFLVGHDISIEHCVNYLQLDEGYVRKAKYCNPRLIASPYCADDVFHFFHFIPFYLFIPFQSKRDT